MTNGIPKAINMKHVLYNPLAGNKTGEKTVKILDEIFGAENLIYYNVIDVNNLSDFLKSLPMTDEIIVAGGDGTVNKFINNLGGIVPEHKIFYLPTGSGNDFFTDVKKDSDDKNTLIPLNDYLKNLPVCEVNGNEYFFINGIGYGIDGYCCEVGDKLRESGKTKIDYAGIAIKGLLFRFKRRKATVTVDGETHSFKNVWLAPTMYGRYYGGGMMIAPYQLREKSGKVTLIVHHCGSKLVTLVNFPKIFKGTHLKNKKLFNVYEGKNVTVEFDRPTAIQIDGETILDVKKYTVYIK